MFLYAGSGLPFPLPKEDRTTQDVSQPLFSFISCASGRRGTLRGPAPHLPSPKGKDKATCTRGRSPCKAAPDRRTDRPQLVRGQDKNKQTKKNKGTFHPPVPPLPGTDKPCPARGRRTHGPWTPQMLHEPFFKGKPVAPVMGKDYPSPSPFPGLWPCATAQVFAQFADPKVLHFSCPPLQVGPVTLPLLLCCVGGPRRKGKRRAGMVALRGPQHRCQVWVLLSTHPLPAKSDKCHFFLSDLLWPLRHVLFLTPSWNWLSSSKNQVLGPHCPPT